MSAKHIYELYGGPLDGATITMNRQVKEGQVVDFDLCRYESIEGNTISKPCGRAAVHSMTEGKLIFIGERELNKKK